MHRIVILGAGYAGMAAAMQLGARTRRRSDVEITLVNATERFTERLRLPMAATGQDLAELDIPTMLSGTGVHFVRGWVTAVDPGARVVRIDDRQTLDFTTLVYALGSVADTASVPGAEEYAYPLDGPAEAAQLVSNIKSAGTVVIGGNGLTGIESAAEIASRYPGKRVVLLGRDEPGAKMAAKPRAYLQAALRRLGVEDRHGVEIAEVLPGAVRLEGGETLPADVFLWAAGTRVPVLAEGLGTDERGRVVTDASLRSVTHPHVYAAGDAAAVRQPYGIMHGTCQGGMPTGVHAAISIVRELNGKAPKPFRFGYYHTPVSLGRHDGVVQFTHGDDTPRRFHLTGRMAARYKESVTAAPWPAYRRMRSMPASGAIWPHGKRAKRA